MWKFKKHILKSAEDQAAPSCPDRAVVIQVCNQNSARDDNFNVFLNGTYIGFLDLSQNDQVGSIMIATTNTNANVLVGDFACPLTLMQTYRFNPSLLLFGPNTLEMRNAQVNNNGNAGTVSIRNYEVIDNDLINPCVIADLTYSGTNGASFTMVFNYTACCPGELDETIIATKDTYTTTFGSGLSGANILVNDSLNGNSVTISNVSITQVYSSNPSVSINTTTGEIIAAANTPVGEHTLVYEICEVGNTANCDQTTIKVIITEATTTTTTTTTTSTTTTSTTTTTTTPPAYTFSNGSILTKTSSSGTVTETLTGTLTVNSGPITLGARVNVGTGYLGYVNFTVVGINSSIVSRQGQGISNGPTFSIPVGVYTYSLRVDASSDGTYTVVTGEVV